MKAFAIFFITLSLVSVGFLYYHTGLIGFFHTWETKPIICVLGVIGWGCVGTMFTCIIGMFELIGTE